MLTNSVITILTQTREGREDIYKPSKSVKAHWEDTRGYNIMQSSRALNEVDNITVYISDMSIEVKANDLIVKGKVVKNYRSYEEVLKDFKDTFIITVVDRFDYGSPNMQHIRIGAK